VQYAVVSNELASVLGVRTVLGRWFVAEEHRYGSDNVAVLTHDGWQREFGGDPSAVGRTMVIDGTPLKIVGVLQPLALEFPKADLAFWTPLAPPTSGPSQWRSGRQSPWLAAVARLRANVTLEQANAELDVIARQLSTEYPTINKSKTYRAQRLRDALVGPVRPVLWLLAGVVAAVLCVACGNVATLLRANANARHGEFAVRASLGGTARRMSQQVLTETASLAGVGGLIGVLAAPLIVVAFLRLYPGSLPSRAQIVLDARVVIIALAMITIAALLAGLPVARHATHGNLANRLRDGGRASSSRSERRYGSMLIAGQVGFSVVLLFAAGVLIRSFWNLTHVNLGFEPRGVLTFWLTPSKSSRPAEALVSQLEATFRAMPGVRDVASSYDIPTAGRSFGASVLREGKRDGEANAPTADVQMVSPRFFSAMGIPIRAGRDINAADRAGAPPVVVVNEAFAARMFPGENPLGRRITVWDTVHTIVGIVGDARRARPLWDPPEPEMYFSIDQRGQSWRYVVIRTDGRTPPAALIPAVRNEVRRLDPTLAISELAFLDDRLRDVTAPQRFRGALVGAIGALALLLSIVGVYGVVTYTVMRRTREIGIRIALGEAGRAIQFAIVRQALRPTMVGVAAGMALALFIARWLEGFVLGISPRDTLTLVSVACLFLVVGVLAAYAPARRASRIDPVLALRGE
jgi:putative ABC transport system permease protein